MGLHEEGVQQAKEASEIFERLGDTAKQAGCLIDLAWVLHDDEQLDVAEEAASRAIEPILEEGEQFLACRGHRVLGKIYDSKGRSPFRDGHRNRIPYQLGRPAVLGSFRPSGLVFPGRQVRRPTRSYRTCKVPRVQ